MPPGDTTAVMGSSTMASCVVSSSAASWMNWNVMLHSVLAGNEPNDTANDESARCSASTPMPPALMASSYVSSAWRFSCATARILRPAISTS